MSDPHRLDCLLGGGKVIVKSSNETIEIQIWSREGKMCIWDGTSWRSISDFSKPDWFRGDWNENQISK